MFQDFNFYKAEQFLLKTNQSKWIVLGVTGLKPYHETDILDMIENIIPCDYYMVEKLYCLVMQELDYNVPFTCLELFYCIKNYPKKKYEGFNKPAYDYVKVLHKRLLRLYPF